MTDIMREWNEALTAPKCEHGHLAPVCDLCKKDAEIAALRAELAQAMKERSRAIAVGDDMEQEVERLTAERDAAFAMSRCECATDEACAELAKLHAEVAGLREDAERWAKEANDRDDIACAWGAACAFIDSHAADPDITQEMQKTYAEFQKWREHLAARKGTT